MKKIFILLFSMLSLVFSSCDYLDVDPVGKVIPQKLTEYRGILTTAYSGLSTYKKLLALRSDELFPALGTPTYDQYIDIALLNDVGYGSTSEVYPWTNMYKTIFYANSVIAGIMEAESDTRDDSREQLMAEALLIRAYIHFELLNLYARPYNSSTAATDRGIPLALKIDIEQEYIPASVEKVYEQILADIAEARTLLQVDEQPANIRYRFSKKSALALEARVRLYRSDWELALTAAEELLPHCVLENLNMDGYTAPYRYDSKESIQAWELTGGTDLSDDANVLSNIIGKYNPEGDLRLGVYYKYSAYSGYFSNKCYDKSMRVTFRSGEIYLIAAEAAAHISAKLDVAKGYLKQLMINRLTPNYYATKSVEIDAMDQQQLLDEIADERARELAMEGHRWYDLRRTARPEIVKNYMDSNFEDQTLIIKQNDSRYVIPFPQEALEGNPNLSN